MPAGILERRFKWAFIGTSNADTAFFADAAHDIVKDLDPDMPYFLTGTLIMLPLSPVYNVFPDCLAYACEMQAGESAKADTASAALKMKL